MGIIAKFFDVLTARLGWLADKAENPVLAIEAAHEKMKLELREIRSHLVSILTEEKLLEQRILDITTSIQGCEEKAKRALQKDREDLARIVLKQKQSYLAQLKILKESYETVKQQSSTFQEQEEQFKLRIDSFRTEKELLKCQYGTAQAQIRVSSSMAGLGKGFNDVNGSLDRIKEKTEEARAKAKALTIMAAKTDSIWGDPRTSTDKEIESLGYGDEIDNDIQRLRGTVTKLNTSAPLLIDHQP